MDSSAVLVAAPDGNNGDNVDGELLDRLMDIYSPNIPQGHIYFRFEDRFYSLDELLASIIFSLPNIQWPVDKEELARTWNNAFIIPSQRHPNDFIHHLTFLDPIDPCFETTLDSRLLSVATAQVEIGRPYFANPSSRVRIPVQSPTHEVMLTTFWNDSFMDVDGYMKRIVIPSDCLVTSIFLNQVSVGLIPIRYSVTYLPHFHRNGHIWNREPDYTDGRFVRWPITCKGYYNANHTTNITCIIWNSLQASLPTCLAVLHSILMEEHPHLMIVTETWLTGEEIPSVATHSGYSGLQKVGADDMKPAMWILWRPTMINITRLASGRSAANILLESDAYSLGLRFMTRVRSWDTVYQVHLLTNNRGNVRCRSTVASSATEKPS